MQQKQIKEGGKTAVGLHAIRQLFETQLGASHKCSFDTLKFWLQAPVLPTGKADSDCERRAANLAPLLSRSPKPYLRPNLSAKILGDSSHQKRWELIDAAVTEGRVVYLYGPAPEVGSMSSVFRDVGHHVVLLLSPGIEGKEEKYYVGFDPDISATEMSKNLWVRLIAAANAMNEEGGNRGFGGAIQHSKNDDTWRGNLRRGAVDPEILPGPG